MSKNIPIRPEFEHRDVKHEKIEFSTSRLREERVNWWWEELQQQSDDWWDTTIAHNCQFAPVVVVVWAREHSTIFMLSLANRIYYLLYIVIRSTNVYIYIPEQYIYIILFLSNRRACDYVKFYPSKNVTKKIYIEMICD